jgi:hypothetical protein
LLWREFLTTRTHRCPAALERLVLRWKCHVGPLMW